MRRKTSGHTRDKCRLLDLSHAFSTAIVLAGASIAFLISAVRRITRQQGGLVPSRQSAVVPVFGTTTVVVPLLGGMTTVVARAGGGSLLTQPASMAPRINKLDTTFIFVSSFKRTWSFERGIIEPSQSVRYGLTGRVSRTYPACVCRRASYTSEAGL